MLVLVVWFCVCEYVCVVFVVCCVRESESGCLCWLFLCRVFVWFLQVLLKLFFVDACVCGVMCVCDV